MSVFIYQAIGEEWTFENWLEKSKVILKFEVFKQFHQKWCNEDLIVRICMYELLLLEVSIQNQSVITKIVMTGTIKSKAHQPISRAFLVEACGENNYFSKALKNKRFHENTLFAYF